MPPLSLRILAGDWHSFMPAPWAQTALAFVAVACGGIIGGERERREKPAGLRTLMLVCLGSALFTIAGYAFTTTTADSGRVAAQIVTGIGFLGAGVILHSRGTISGMTTAATIWVTAAIGMLAATGYAGGALGASILIRLLLFGVWKWEILRLNGIPLQHVEVIFQCNGGKTRVRIERVLVGYGPATVQTEWRQAAEEQQQVILGIRLPRHHLHDLLGALADIPQVSSIAQGADK
jgi:putative Mg2+ transporter-C (MgtC) family protein